MIGILSRKIFDIKVINAETKICWTSVVFPKTGRVQARMVSVWSIGPCRAIVFCQECVDCFLFSLVIVDMVDIVMKGLDGVHVLER